jgi:hypothetical protein
MVDIEFFYELNKLISLVKRQTNEFYPHEYQRDAVEEIYNLLRGFSEILTLAVDGRQSIAYLCGQQKH